MILFICFGGVLGTLSRYYLGKWIMSHRLFMFPLGTWVINITGSLLLGVLFSLHLQSSFPDWIWGMFGIGFCGAYTTFSTFGLETISLIKSGKLKLCALYVISSVGLGILAVFIGMSVIQHCYNGATY